jgi:hypothetical protein
MKKISRRAIFIAAIFLLLGLTSGCTTTRPGEALTTQKIAVLEKNLCALSPTVDSNEAERVAEAAVIYPLQLAQDWRVTPPAIFNNTLINAGIHPRGLCYQWADALTAKLLTLHLRTLEIHRGVAKLGTRREHSCVVLTAMGQNFTNGLALDAWRDCGRLHFAPVKKDDYAWQEVDLIPSYAEELRAAAEKMERSSNQP